MSRTMTMKLAGACALAMTIASGALAHGGGASVMGTMGGARSSVRATIPRVNANRPVMDARIPALTAKTAIKAFPQPVTGTRIPVLTGERIRAGVKTPTVNAPKLSTGSNGAQLDPPSGNQ